VKAKKLHGLLKKVDECLSLKSDDAELQKLRGQLQAREEKNAAQEVANVIEKAQSLREECRFEAAANALRRIPQQQVTQEASDLLEDCDALGTLREMSMRSLKSAMDTEEHKSGLAKTKDYRDSLKENYLEDEEFSRALAACQRALKDKRASERRRALMIKLSVAGAAVTAVVLLIAAGLWIRSSMRASALADAVEQQNWDEALAIDGQHVPALIGRAKQRLNAGIPDIEGAFEDIRLAEQVDSTAAELKPAKALAHAKKAAVQQAAAEKVAAEKIAEAEKAAVEKIAEAAKAAAEKAAVEIAAAKKAVEGQEPLTLKGHSGGVWSVRFGPDGKRIVSGGDPYLQPGEIKVWDSQTGEETLALNGHTERVSSVSFSPDGKRIVSGSYDKTVKVWDAQTGQETLTLKGHASRVYSVSFSPDGKRIVSGGGMFNTGEIKVWDAQTGQETLTLKGHSGLVDSVSFSPDGKWIVSGSFDKTIKIWDSETGRETATLKGHTSGVRSVSFSPDGKRIVSGSRDTTLKVWDWPSAAATLTLKGHSDNVTSVCFSPDGKRIVSGSYDDTLKVWDAQTGQETLTLRGHSGSVFSLSYSPDGNRIVSGSYDKTVKVWDISSLDTSK
jgi:Tol biopolymer transport system component